MNNIIEKKRFIKEKKYNEHFDIYFEHNNENYSILIINKSEIYNFYGKIFNTEDKDYNDLKILIEILSLIKDINCYVNIHTTSNYVRYLLNEWLTKWKKQNFIVQSTQFSISYSQQINRNKETYRPYVNELKIITDLLKNKQIRSVILNEKNYYDILTSSLTVS